MQQLLAWLKDLSSRRSKDGGDWLNPCRASMKLPPIPKEFQSRCPDVSRYCTDSPAHIYEEIPSHRDGHKLEGNEKTGDLNGDKTSANDDSSEAREHDVDITNLAFDKAKTFGAYLVVPMKDKLNATGVGVSCVAAEHRLPVTSDCLDESCCSRKTSTSDSGVSVDTSGGSERGHETCSRHRRRHIVYDDVPCMDYDDDVIERDLARSDKTALGRAMFRHRDHNRELFAVQVENVPAHHRDHVFYNDLDSRCDMSVPCEGDESSRMWRSQSDIPSNESSDGSSIYPTSLSDGDRRLATTSGGICCSNSSDSNNDTFSEYGVHCDHSGVRGGDSAFRRPSEYDYLLSRVRHNFTLGAEVQRHIRSSDSSDYETNSSVFSGDGYDDINADIVSLTSITSLSGISSTDERESRVRPHTIAANRTRCRGNITKGEAPSRGRPSAVQEPLKQRKSSTVNGVDSKKTRRTKPIEYYRLPDFPHRTATAGAAHTDNISERLSCRATTFHRAGKPETRKTHDRAGSAHARPAKHPPNSQNRLLTDLMRMNHDRQLLVLF